jgi:hypothetical protein
VENTNLPATQNNTINQNPIGVLKNLNSFTKIKEFDKIGHIVILICNKHAVLSGIDKEIDPFTKEEIAKYTALHLKNLTFEEIEIAFQNERFNLYDKKSIHYNFFSIDYFVEIIKKYKQWKQQEMLKHNIQISTPSLIENTVTEFDKKQTTKSFIIYLFNELNETKVEYLKEAFTLYEDFVENKLIIVTIEEKKELYRVMLKEVKREYNKEIFHAKNDNVKNTLKKILEKIQSENKNNFVANRCKAYLVCQSIKSYNSADSILKKNNLL